MNQKLVIDFHFHSKLTSGIDFDSVKFIEKLVEAKNAGLTAIVLTEHCHANMLGAYKWLSENYKYVDDHYELDGELDGFKIFTGVEVSTNEGQDVIIISNREKIEILIDKIININMLLTNQPNIFPYKH